MKESHAIRLMEGRDQRERKPLVRIAVLISDGFEQNQFEGPVGSLKRAGAEVEILAGTQEQVSNGIRGVNHIKPADRVWPNRLLLDASPDQYQGILIPGGAISVDAMRESIFHRAFAKAFLNDGKPIALIAHGAWLLADSGALRGYTLTSWPAIKKDLERAGAIWKDQEIIRDRNLITSQKASSSAELSDAFINEIKELGLNTGTYVPS